MIEDEFFDVVDEHDKVIGRESRRDVHRQGLKHRAVHVLVFNSRGELYLQKRSQTKDTFPGAWDSSAAGHLCCGEDYDSCAGRELQEEIGWTPREAPQRLFKLPAQPETGWEHVWVYRTVCDEELKPNPEEIERGEWFAPQIITHWMAEKPHEFASSFPVIWRRYLLENGSTEK